MKIGVKRREQSVERDVWKQVMEIDGVGFGERRSVESRAA